MPIDYIKVMKGYPIKFVPIIKEKIWGGQRLRTLLHKDFGSLPNGGESWELSCVEGDVSVIANGALAGMSLSEAIGKYREALVGRSVYERFGDRFPLLIKFIDAADDLSIQVHPDDEKARQMGLGSGKTEMWYVLAADEGARLVSGFRHVMTPEEYEQRIADGSFEDSLRQHAVSAGDVFFMPAGRIHAIGRGVMVAEVQQTSDVTFRVYDYNRRDAEGHLRQLHIEQAKEALHFSDVESGRRNYSPVLNGGVGVVECKYFVSSLVVVSDGVVMRDYSSIDSAVVLMCVKGAVQVGEERLEVGETCMLPAVMKSVVLQNVGGLAELLEVYVPSA